ncbi:hypothetical protein J4433_01680 [Candidatus Pacearchaeota archaeon]|nr:hypothetical protein [Candidatus Pacearchaeota archaeon]
MTEKKAQIPFQFVFAIIVGAVILFLALFAVSRYMNIQRYQYDTELAAKLSVLLNPIESSIASAVATRIDLPVQTRMQLSCVYSGIGREDLKIATFSTFGKKWQEYGATQNIYNKYVFSKFQEGKVLYVFSKPFEMPFKVADLTYAVMQDYCFVNPPDKVLSELNELNMSNMHAVYRLGECRKGSRTVCFQNSACEINVYGQCFGLCEDIYDYGIVENRADSKVEIVYYLGLPLMYAAVFSDSEMYKCNVQRLMSRLSLVSKLYAEKSKLLDARGCGTGKLREKMSVLSTQASYLTKGGNIQMINDFVKQAENENNGLVCRVF